MPYGSYRGGGGYQSRPPASNPRKFLVGSYSALADAGTGNIAINVPVDAAQGKGIQIWSVEFEFSDASWIGTDNKDMSITLARTAGTAERFINDPDVIHKWMLHSEAITTANGTAFAVVPMTIDKDFYPAVPVIGPQLHVTIHNHSGAAQTVYVKIWYTDMYVSYPQAVGLLQSQVI